MKRLCCLIVLAAAGCQTPEEIPLAPLPKNGEGIPFPDLLQRARVQASTATEAFYVNNWDGLVISAEGLEKVGHLIRKASEVPPNLQGNVDKIASDLSMEATALRLAAKAKDVEKTNSALQQINLMVRKLRPEK